MSETPPEPAPLLTVDCWLIDVRGLSATQAAAWDGAEAAQRARAAVLAASALRALTGGAVEPCLHVVRPTAGPCAEATWQVHPVDGRGTGWGPALDSGTWINRRCGCGSTECGHPGVTIRLPGATRIGQVMLGGVELDESAYRLEAGGVLRRTDGGVWPRTQPLNESPDGVHAFVVSYWTTRPGAAGELAAGRLAAEFLAALSGGTCALPQSVTQVTRQGVTITKTPGVFPGGLTGLTEVDAWVRAVNPYNLPEPSEVLSPDLPRLNATAPVVAWVPPAGGFDGGTP